MRKYYLFVIKKEFSRVYQENADTLYKTLENLYKINPKNYNYGISLYKQLCLPFNVEVLSNYFTHQPLIKKINNKNKFFYRSRKEFTIVKINYSCCIVISSLNLASILKLFDYYSKDVFVCDFENKDYFWLSKQFNKK